VGVPGEELSGLFDIVHLIETDQIDGQTSHDGLHQRDLTPEFKFKVQFQKTI